MEFDSTNVILYVSNVSKPEDLKKNDKWQMWHMEMSVFDFVKICTSIKKLPATVVDPVSNLFYRFSASYLSDGQF